MSEHTPGPWEWRECRMWGGKSGLFANDGEPVCVPNTSNDGDTGAAWFGDMLTEADARLIAAAPEMLQLICDIYGGLQLGLGWLAGATDTELARLINHEMSSLLGDDWGISEPTNSEQ